MSQRTFKATPAKMCARMAGTYGRRGLQWHVLSQQHDKHIRVAMVLSHATAERQQPEGVGGRRRRPAAVDQGGGLGAAGTAPADHGHPHLPGRPVAVLLQLDPRGCAKLSHAVPSLPLLLRPGAPPLLRVCRLACAAVSAWYAALHSTNPEFVLCQRPSFAFLNHSRSTSMQIFAVYPTIHCWVQLPEPALVIARALLHVFRPGPFAPQTSTSMTSATPRAHGSLRGCSRAAPSAPAAA